MNNQFPDQWLRVVFLVLALSHIISSGTFADDLPDPDGKRGNTRSRSRSSS